MDRMGIPLDIREASAFIQRLVDRSPVVFFRRTADGNALTYISSNCERVLGVTPEEIVGIEGSWQSRVHPEDLRWYARGGDRLATSGRAEDEYRFRRSDGGYIWLHCIQYAERDESGALTGLLGYVTDITERMTVLAVLRGAHAEMQAMNEQLTEARDAAESANQAKSEFLSGMSHEIRTPLNAILGFAQLLKMSKLEDADLESVDEILKGGRHLLSLVEEVLDIAHIEAGNVSLSMEPVALEEVCRECVALVRPLASSNDVVLADLSTEDRHFVLADRQRVKQVLLNLLSNAIKYNRRGGRAEVTIGESDARIVFSVIDTGTGIPRHKMGAVFKPFDRLGAERTAIEGTGLGLALSRRLVEAMGGRITVSSAPEGSTFSVHLERAERPAALERASGGERAAGSGDPGAEARTIIYIEDNISNLRLVEHILERRPGVRLHAALQGRLGLDLVRQHRPDLVLLDLNLADIDGAQILTELKDEPDTARIPVVVISADANPLRIEELMSSGARDYLTKPLEVGRFLAVLDGILRESYGETGAGRGA